MRLTLPQAHGMASEQRENRAPYARGEQQRENPLLKGLTC